jgi:hypothetical protein
MLQSKPRYWLAVFGFLALAGCAAQVQLVPSGGSRADGVIDMSTELGAMRTPEIDWADARKVASSRCAAWGYSQAEAFGTLEQKCIETDPKLGCLTYAYTAKYQCSVPSAQRVATPVAVQAVQPVVATKKTAPAQPPANYKPCTADQIRQGICQ